VLAVPPAAGRGALGGPERGGQFRAVATRYGKRKQIYQGTVDIASTRIWLRKPAT
jgi:transposase